MSRVLINGQDVNLTDGFPEMNYDEWKALPRDLRPDFTIIKDRNYTNEPLDNSVSVTVDGVKTYGQLLTELSALVDYSKITRNSKLILGNMIHPVVSIISGDVRFSVSTQHTQNRYYSQTIHLNLAKFYLYDIQNGTPTGYDFTNNVPASGAILTLYYNIVSSGGIGDIDAEDVTYNSGTVEDALDGLNDDVVEYYDYAVTMVASSSVSPFTYYNSVDISAFASGKKILSAQPIVINSAQSAIATINNTQTTAYVYGTDSTNIVLRVAAKKA